MKHCSLPRFRPNEAVARRDMISYDVRLNNEDMISFN